MNTIWYYCAEDTDASCPTEPGDTAPPKFVSFSPLTPTINRLKTIGTGKGYIFVTDEPDFTKRTDGSQFPPPRCPCP